LPILLNVTWRCSLLQRHVTFNGMGNFVTAAKQPLEYGCFLNVSFAVKLTAHLYAAKRPENITLKSDAESVYIHGLFQQRCRDLGINTVCAPPHQHGRNGSSEKTPPEVIIIIIINMLMPAQMTVLHI
jgi:hypothetical protein